MSVVGGLKSQNARNHSDYSCCMLRQGKPRNQLDYAQYQNVIFVLSNTMFVTKHSVHFALETPFLCHF